MPQPVVPSSNWTGPTEDQLAPHLGAPTYGLGEASSTSYYQQIAATAERPQPMSREGRRWLKTVCLFLLSPLLLLASWLFAHAATPDELWSDHREWLILWGLGLIVVFVREYRAGRPVDPRPRIAFLAFVLSATLEFAVWYPYAVLTAHGAAIASQPERTFELYRSCGRNCGYYVHQRANGTTVEGIWVGNAVPYGSTCTLTQRLNGDRGFSWIRVIDRSPPPEHELIWPIRREDCFSDKPLATIRT